MHAYTHAFATLCPLSTASAADVELIDDGEVLNLEDFDLVEIDENDIPVDDSGAWDPLAFAES